MPNYENLSEEISKLIERDRSAEIRSKYAFDPENVIRRDSGRDKASALRPAFVRDADKIMHCPYYNRYADKTQVFSLRKNDDITRRALHVQLVSRIARTLSRALGLDADLTEAIALGHDIGHAPFGHAGERYLDEILFGHTGKHFSHNIQSVRVLDGIFPYNISLQTLNGIAAHDGEMELSEYRPVPLSSFSEFDEQIKGCICDKENIKKLVPCTLEGCVVRISDIISYLGKDRQDAERAHLSDKLDFEDGAIGTINAEMIHNLMVNIVENSYGKPYIRMDAEHFDALCRAKAANYELIYKSGEVTEKLEDTVRPMMREMYEKLLFDLLHGDTSSVIFTHHINYVNKAHYKRSSPYEDSSPDTIVTDYIASMTDDYFIDLYAYLFPNSNKKIEYTGYFD